MTIYTPYWWEEAPRPDPPQTALADDCDVAIIGTGYTGLAAAIELARAGRSVQVFDKSRAGEAASSRSGGIGSGNLRLSFAKMLARLGRQKAEAYYREGIEARADLSRFIEAEGIQCHFDPVGRFIGAVRPAHYESLAREAELLNKHFDLAAFSVPKSEQHKEIGSDAYHGGMVRPDIAGLQPALLHQGILDCALGGGVTVHAKTAVSGIQREASGFEVMTVRGRTRARDVFVAGNGYTDAATPWLRRRLVPVPSLMIATDHLDPAVMDKLCPKRRMLGDTNRLHNYFRPSPDGSRILFGGRTAGRLAVDGPVPFAYLHNKMIGIFPDLAEVGLSHIWWGFVAMNIDHLPQLAVKDGVHYAAGFCGSGIVWARWLGRKAALKVLGDATAVSAFEGQPFAAVPFYNGNPWFLPAVVTWFKFLDAFGL